MGPKVDVFLRFKWRHIRRTENKMLCCPFSRLAMHFTFTGTKLIILVIGTQLLPFNIIILPLWIPSLNFLEEAFLCFMLGAQKGFMDWPLK